MSHAPVLAHRSPGRRRFVAVPLAALLASVTLLIAPPVTAITGGSGVSQAAFDSRWPFAVSIVRPLPDGGDLQHCTGSLVTPTSVVTAAHCLDVGFGLGPTDLIAVVGATDWRASGTRHTVVSSVRDDAEDVAVLRLAEPANRPVVAVPVPGANVPGTVTAAFAGWGLASTDGTNQVLPDVLHEGSTTVGSTNEGGRLIWGSTGLPSTCSGDSGGPLVVPVAGMPTLVGVASFGDGTCTTNSGWSNLLGAAGDFVRNEAFRPQARATITPTEGAAPLTVQVDLSASTTAQGGSILSRYSFEPGDGRAVVSSVTPVIEHTYTSPGVYNAVFCVIDGQGRQGCSDAVISVTGEGTGPTIQVSRTPSNGDPALTVTFDFAGTVDADGEVVEYAVDPGDGRDLVRSATPSVEVTYTTDGTYFPRAQATDDSGYTTVSTELLRVVVGTGGDGSGGGGGGGGGGGANRPPVLVVNEVSPLVGPAPLTVTFDLSGSSDPDGDALIYFLDPGDGDTQFTSTEPVLEYTYTTDGEYIATVAVLDGTGDTPLFDLQTFTVQVGDGGGGGGGGGDGGGGGGANRPPVLVINAMSELVGPAPLTVTFDLSGSSDPDGDPLTFVLATGDGDEVVTSTDPFLEYTYTTVGEYEVMVAVVDGADDTSEFDLATFTVTVGDGGGGGGGGGGNIPPVLVVTEMSLLEGPAPLTVSIDLTGSFDPDGEAVTYVLQADLNDASTRLESGSALLQYTYTDPGVYSAAAGVTDEFGESDFAEFTVIVSDPVPTLVFGGFVGLSADSPTNVKAGSTVPVRWRITDADGAVVDSLASIDGPPTQTPIDCGTQDATGGSAAAQSRRGLRFDTGKQQFVFDWVTSREGSGCWAFDLVLTDGSSHRAIVNLR